VKSDDPLRVPVLGVADVAPEYSGARALRAAVQDLPILRIYLAGVRLLLNVRCSERPLYPLFRPWGLTRGSASGRESSKENQHGQASAEQSGVDELPNGPTLQSRTSSRRPSRRTRRPRDLPPACELRGCHVDARLARDPQCSLPPRDAPRVAITLRLDELVRRSRPSEAGTSAMVASPRSGSCSRSSPPCSIARPLPSAARRSLDDGCGTAATIEQCAGAALLTARHPPRPSPFVEEPRSVASGTPHPREGDDPEVSSARSGS
jgi:hypothetical protein